MAFKKGNTPWNKGLKLTPLSEAHKQNISESMKGKQNRKGHHPSEETRRKISRALRNRQPWNTSLTKETSSGVRVMADAKKGIRSNPATEFKKGHTLNVGEDNPWYGIRGKKHPRYGKHHTEESNQKNRLAHLGKKQSEETIKKKSGSNSGSWLDGISKLPYAFDFNEELKELIKKRDGYKCQFPECGTDADLCVHHVDYQKLNSDPLNLITLCRSHNIKVNTNRDYWEEYFTTSNLLIE